MSAGPGTPCVPTRRRRRGSEVRLSYVVVCIGSNACSSAREAMPFDTHYRSYLLLTKREKERELVVSPLQLSERTRWRESVPDRITCAERNELGVSVWHV